jgi:tRNA (Thr-GGU) A37 N-methylase
MIDRSMCSQTHRLPVAHIVRLIDVNGPTLLVRGLDCIDGTPLIDIKPDRTLFTPLAPRQPGDDQVGDEPDRSRG